MNRYKTFFSYVLPSLLAFALSGVYAIVDGFFVGNSIGDAGLSAINIAYPVTALIQAAGTGIGMGGAVMYSVRMAEEKPKDARDFLQATLLYLAAGSVLLTALLFPLIPTLLRIMGASGYLLTLGEEYLFYIILGAALQVFATGLVPVIRNNGGSLFAMFCMIAGFLTNIVLDYAFVWVWKYGMAGAAAATIIGQGVTMLGGFIYLIRRKLLCLHFPANALASLLSIVKIGLAPFGATMCPMISLLFMNRASMSYGGEPGVACYACISYITSVLYLILQGVGDGSQPLMSRYYGMGKTADVRDTCFLAYMTALIIGALCIAGLYITRFEIGVLFGASGTVSLAVAQSLPIFLAGIPFLAISRVTTSAFYATEQSLFSYILVYAEPLSLVIFLAVLPSFFQMDGVWWSTALSQVFAALLALVLKKYSDAQGSIRE